MNDATPIAERKESFDLSPRSLQEALTFCDMLAKSDMVPKGFEGKPGNIMVAVQWGMEIGLKPMQAMQNIAVINGRPSLWGDSVLALVIASPACKDVIEHYEGTGDDYRAVCIAQRHGKQDKVGTFSLADAKKAGLIGKSGPWTQYRDRMLKLRARSFALRDQFPDVLKGMDIAEVLQDIEAIPSTAVRQSATGAAEAARGTVDSTSKERADLIAALEKVQKESGSDKLSVEWKALTKDQRKLVGPDEIERIKRLEVEKATPTYAELMERINSATDAKELDAVISDSTGLPEDQRAEIAAACEKKFNG